MHSLLIIYHVLLSYVVLVIINNTCLFMRGAFIQYTVYRYLVCCYDYDFVYHSYDHWYNGVVILVCIVSSMFVSIFVWGPSDISSLA